LRTAILTGGALVVGLLLGLLVGLVAGTVLDSPEQAQRPKTVTVERIVTVPTPEQASPSPSPTATATAGLNPEQATKSCQVGKACELGPGTVTIEQAQKTQTLTSDYSSPRSGNFVVVNFSYTWNGDQPVTLGEIPWTLTDGDGRTYTYDFDATNTYSDVNESIIYADVQPGVTKGGKAIYAVAPNSQDFTLTITDLATPQAGEAANVEL
jgi:Domain of unknown function (DUF4352)